MAFEWDAFLSQYKIDFKSERNDLYIKCPFCGNADEGKHMGLSTRGEGWGCWRNNDHRGKNPQRLVQRLLGCSWDEAGRLIGRRPGGALGLSNDALGQMLAGFKEKEATRLLDLKFPQEFRKLAKAGKSARLFHDYLLDRGFSSDRINMIAPYYNLMWTLVGDYAYRLILPVYDQKGNLVTWTGRSVGDSGVRYKTLSDKEGRPGRPVAFGPITDYLLDLPNVFQGGEFLVITEGPFDVLKLSPDTIAYRAAATCLFGKVISDAQLDLIAEVKEKYKTIFMMLDPEALSDTLRLAGVASSLGVVPFFLKGDKDPGDMMPKEVRHVLDQLYEASQKRIPAFANFGRLP